MSTYITNMPHTSPFHYWISYSPPYPLPIDMTGRTVQVSTVKDDVFLPLSSTGIISQWDTWQVFFFFFFFFCSLLVLSFRMVETQYVELGWLLYNEASFSTCLR